MQNGELRPIGHRTIHGFDGANAVNALKQKLGLLIFQYGSDSFERAANEIYTENGHEPLFDADGPHAQPVSAVKTNGHTNGHDHAPTSRSLGAHAGWATKRAVTEYMGKNPKISRDAALAVIRGQHPAPVVVERVRPRNFKSLKKGQKSWFTRVQKFIDAAAAHGTVLDWATAEKQVHAQWIENRGIRRQAA
jgi:hypothetical protein